MKLLLLCLALAVVPALSQPREGPATPLAIVTDYQHEPSVIVRDALKSELDSIMLRIGLQFTWTTFRDNSHNEVFRDLAVATFVGHCDLVGLSAAMAPTKHDGPLGWTHVSNGRVLPFSDIDCDSIRGFLALELLRLDPTSREAVYGRAVARVLAHELYHAFTRTQLHGSLGLTKSSHSAGDLMGAEFTFQEADAILLASTLAEERPAQKAVDSGQSIHAGIGCAGCDGRNGKGTSNTPLLRKSGNVVRVKDLISHLKSKASQMCRAAQYLKILLPSLPQPYAQSLATFLNSGADEPTQNRVDPDSSIGHL
jgi:hypothetical protein